MILLISESSDEDLDDIAIGPGASDSEVRKYALYVGSMTKHRTTKHRKTKTWKRQNIERLNIEKKHRKKIKITSKKFRNIKILFPSILRKQYFFDIVKIF